MSFFVAVGGSVGFTCLTGYLFARSTGLLSVMGFPGVGAQGPFLNGRLFDPFRTARIKYGIISNMVSSWDCFAYPFGYSFYCIAECE